MWKLSVNQKLEIVSDYLNGMSMYRIAKKYGVSNSSIVSILKVRGVKKPGSKRKYTYDKDFFTTPTTEIQSYWLGFLYAEGNLHRTTLGLKLSNTDLDHLHKFRAALSCLNPIKSVKDKNASVIKLTGKELTKQLMQLGITPNKKDHLVYPLYIKDLPLQKHFIRGFVDGDGWITYSKSSKTWHIGISSCSLQFLKEIRQAINLELKLEAGSICVKEYTNKKGEKRRCWQLAYGGNVLVSKIAGWLYSDAEHYLNRKRDIYIKMIGKKCATP